MKTIFNFITWRGGMDYREESGCTVPRWELEAWVRGRERRDLFHMSAIAAGAWVTLLTVEAVTIFLMAA
jgi:hypothetical protein